MSKSISKTTSHVEVKVVAADFYATSEFNLNTSYVEAKG